MANIPISTNLFAQAGDERDPRTLGTDVTTTPGGEFDVAELLGGRIEDLDTIAETQRATLEALSRQFERVSNFEYDPKFMRQPADTLIGKLIHLKRAHNPQYDQRQRMKFEMLKTQEMMKIAQTMAGAAAQLRQADPGADAFIKSKMKEAGEVAGQMARLRGAKVMAAEAVRILREEYGPDNVPPTMERRLFAHFSSIPSAEEMIKADIDRRAALARIEPGLTDEEIAELYPEEGGFLKEIRKHRMSTSGKKADPAQFMQFQNLSKILNDQIDAALDDLTTPALLTLRESGTKTQKMLKLPRDPELVQLARIRAVERFKRIVAANMGEGKVGRAMEIAGIADMEPFLQDRGELTPQQMRDETEAMRNDVIERMRAQAGALGQ